MLKSQTCSWSNDSLACAMFEYLFDNILSIDYIWFQPGPGGEKKVALRLLLLLHNQMHIVHRARFFISSNFPSMNPCDERHAQAAEWISRTALPIFVGADCFLLLIQHSGFIWFFRLHSLWARKSSLISHRALITKKFLLHSTHLRNQSCMNEAFFSSPIEPNWIKLFSSGELFHRKKSFLRSKSLIDFSHNIASTFIISTWKIILLCTLECITKLLLWSAHWSRKAEHKRDLIALFGWSFFSPGNLDGDFACIHALIIERKSSFPLVVHGEPHRNVEGFLI